MPDFQAVAIQQWQALMGLKDRRHADDIAEHKREALELLHAAVLYQAHSFPHFGSLLHMKWVLPALPPRAGAYWGHETEELPFGLFLSPNLTIAQMHLASAAVRLPVALQKTIEAYPAGAEAAFADLWGVPLRHPKWRADWLRCKIKDRFLKVKALDHCAMSPLGTTASECLQHAITVVMVIRDDFGHGEDGGFGPDTYRGERQDVVKTLYTCRIVEAHQILVDWAIEQFR